jgi:hypothetical protein
MEEDTGCSGKEMVFLRTPGARDTITLRQATVDEAVGSGGGLDHSAFVCKTEAI